MRFTSLLTSVFLAGAINLHAANPSAKSALEGRIDSLSAELAMLERILESKGLDLAKARQAVLRADSVFQIDLTDAPILGPADAKVTVVGFLDLECPYCARVEPMFQALREKHPKDLKIAFRNFPLSFHANALPGHKALWAAGKQGKFWEYYLGASSQGRNLTDSLFVRLAKENSLDMKRWEADRASPATAAAIQRDIERGEALGVEGTPTLYVNGKLSRDPLSDVEAAIAALKSSH